MIRRYETCVGLSLPSIGRYKVEIWYIPANYTIPPHAHSQIDSTLFFFLFGNGATFYKRPPEELFPESYQVKWIRDFGRRFKIKAGVSHWFSTAKWPIIFFNLEKWKMGVKPTSAAIDLQLTKQ